MKTMKTIDSTRPNKKTKTKGTYSVYVIRLKDIVLLSKKFRKANPEYQDGKPCYYVGYTGKDVEVRAEEHRTRARNKRGRLYSSIAHEYFDGLRPTKYKKYKPETSRILGEAKEKWLAEKLRSLGYVVWSH